MPGHRTAILIACKNGEETIGATVESVVNQADVFVASDGSTDATVARATEAGATAIELHESHGKPGALRAGMATFRLEQRYTYIGVLDDDTLLGPGYVAQVERVLDADRRAVAASGRVDARWDAASRWNAYVAMRAFMYWSYQTTIKRGQNAFGVVNVICGANTLFRSEVFASLLAEDAPYAIDDMFWLAEIVRRRLGRVKYVHTARSYTIDPHTFRDWYRQTVRWSWGQFQSIRGHRLGLPLRRGEDGRLAFSWFDLAYLALLLDWIPYMLEPVIMPPVAVLARGLIDPIWFAIFYVGSTALWIGAAAAALRRPQLVVLVPALIALDLVYRVTMMHAVAKAVARPRVATCRWDSPTRFSRSAAAHQPPVSAIELRRRNA